MEVGVSASRIGVLFSAEILLYSCLQFLILLEVE
jgi:hypothetical protein